MEGLSILSQSTTASAMRATLVCFGQDDGLGEIEVSSSFATFESLGTRESVFSQEEGGDSRTQNRSIRLFHTLNIEDTEDDDDYDEEVSFEDSGDVDQPLFQEVHPPAFDFPEQRSSSTVSSRVLAAIDTMEKALDDVHQSQDDDNAYLSSLTKGTCSTSSSTPFSKPVSMKSLMKRFHCTKITFNKDSATKNEEEDSIPPYIRDQKRAPVSSHTKKSSWNSFFSKKRNRQNNKKRAGDTALLVPHKAPESDWFLQGETDQVKPQTIQKSKKKKRTRFLHRLLLGGCFLTEVAEENVMDPHDSHQDDTRALSLEEEDETDEHEEDTRKEDDKLQQPKKRFRSDEELIDHLVKSCNTTSSLEEGFNCLQERIRARPFCRVPAVSPHYSEPHPIFSTPSLLDTCTHGAQPALQPTPPSATTPSTIPGTPTNTDSQNDSIRSFGSLEEFLSSSFNDNYDSEDDHSLSLEAILFEQELEKLTTEELAELLDEELEKLMREGLA